VVGNSPQFVVIRSIGGVTNFFSMRPIFARAYSPVPKIVRERVVLLLFERPSLSPEGLGSRELPLVYFSTRPSTSSSRKLDTNAGLGRRVTPPYRSSEGCCPRYCSSEGCISSPNREPPQRNFSMRPASGRTYSKNNSNSLFELVENYLATTNFAVCVPVAVSSDTK